MRRATARLPFLASHTDRIKGTSAHIQAPRNGPFAPEVSNRGFLLNAIKVPCEVVTSTIDYISNCRLIGVGRQFRGGIELGKLFFRPCLYPVAPVTHGRCEAVEYDLIAVSILHPEWLFSILRDELKHYFIEKHSQGVEVAGKGIRAHAEGFQRNRPAAGKRVHDQRPSARCTAQCFMGGLGSARLVSK